MPEDRETKRFNQMTAPILTRWWLVGKQFFDVDANWTEWNMIMEGIIKMEVTNRQKTTAIKEIAIANLQIMRVKEIQLGVNIIVSIHNYWAFKHFKYV